MSAWDWTWVWRSEGERGGAGQGPAQPSCDGRERVRGLTPVSVWLTGRWSHEMVSENGWWRVTWWERVLIT